MVLRGLCLSARLGRGVFTVLSVLLMSVAGCAEALENPERHPPGTACTPGDQWARAPWLFRNSVQWAPDGSAVLFTAGPRIHAVAADGSRLWQVVEPAPVGGHQVGSIAPFTLSPDGEQIVYATCEYPSPHAQALVGGDGLAEEDYRYELAHTHVDGTQHQRLTVNEWFDNHPAWSPDGTRIAFLSHDYEEGSGYVFLSAIAPRLYTMAPDGSELHRLTPSLNTIAHHPPAWAPDGQQIAIVAIEPEQRQQGIYIVGADGTGLRRLTSTVSGPSWAPDGKRLAFAKAEDTTVALYTIAADGTDAQRVTTIEGWQPQYGEPDPTRAWIETVAWSPDGSKILYSCRGICVVTLDGKPVSDAPLAGDLAAWAPDGARIAIVSSSHHVVLSTIAPDGGDRRVLVARGAADELRAPAAPAAQGPVDVRACTAGVVIPDPAANPGLVQDCQALVALWARLTSDPPLNWTADRPLTEWEGVVVSGSPPRVQELQVEGRGLWGPLPPALGQLTQLRVLDMRGNRLGGEIPAALGELRALEHLSLSHNLLHGPIPAALGQLTNLRGLVLHVNQLSGEIPVALGELARLQLLVLDANALTGAIPGALMQLSNLRGLRLEQNQLRGPLPAALGQLTELEVLDLSANQLTGTLPVALGQLTKLRQLDLSGNQLTGALPAVLGQLANLEQLELQDNELTGAIPAELGELSRLRTLRLAGNALTGCILAALEGLPSRDLGPPEHPFCDVNP